MDGLGIKNLTFYGMCLYLVNGCSNFYGDYYHQKNNTNDQTFFEETYFDGVNVCCNSRRD